MKTATATLAATLVLGSASHAAIAQTQTPAPAPAAASAAKPQAAPAPAPAPTSASASTTPAPSPAAAPAAPKPAELPPGQVRPVPPAGVPVSDSDRRWFEAELSTLAAELRKLRAKPEAARFVPDVEIYYRAVDTALRNDEFFAPEDISKARELIVTGKVRALALSAGRTPWLEKTGPVALGYVSRIDGSVQPYGVTLPPKFAENAAQRFRLDAWFHGRAEKLSEVNFIAGVSKSPGEFAGPNAILLQLYGRYCNGSKFAGETDFHEALADVKGRFPIDEDRIVIRGFSLGGHSAWQIGSHFAADWAAVAPGAGFSESREFLTMFEKDKLTFTPWEEKLWQLYDAPPYAKNLRNVPVVAYSGDKDKQKQASDLMAVALRKVGVDLVHVIGPDTAHKYHPDAKREINRLVDLAAARGRDPLPRRVSLATPTLRYNRQAWLQVDALDEHWKLAELEGSLRDREIAITTSNTRALRIAIPTGRSPFFPGEPAPAIVIDGQRVTGPLPASDRSYTAAFVRQGRRWVAGSLSEGDLRKRSGLQGPIDDAFMDSFLIVTPESRTTSAEVNTWVRGEQTRAIKEWRRQFRGDARVKLDSAVSDADIAAHNLILWGDPRGNAVYKRIADRLPITWTEQSITVGKQVFSADKHALIAIYPNPLNPKRYVVINSGFTFREYAALNNARQTPKLPDWAVVDVSTKPDIHAPGKIVAADFFDESWKVRVPARKPQQAQAALIPAAPKSVAQ
ncbi:MAG TPA: prolyl oligopeptidase family serine peptidase [Polyangia bacterium]